MDILGDRNLKLYRLFLYSKLGGKNGKDKKSYCKRQTQTRLELK